ncbi:DUF2612 domain-containing protein [Pseudomonas laurylsulfatiphila]|uniref:DUF2612 domain-containing protein n=1 Tax=Pseudomonas laurylsulfatiphila TaxID=2011015 RepID=UPI003D22DB22
MSYRATDFKPLPPSKSVEFAIPSSRIQTLLLSQFKDSPNLSAYIGCFIAEVDIISKAIEDTINLRYLADASGSQLDVVGEIVGIGRIFYGAAALGYFGFYDDPQSAIPSIGDKFDSTVGGVYKSITDRDSADYVMDDDTYKKAIYAKIVKNMTNCCIEDVLLYIDLIIGFSCDTQITESSCHVDIYVHENLNQLQRISLSLLIAGVRPVGVSMTLRDNHGTITVREVAN